MATLNVSGNIFISISIKIDIKTNTNTNININISISTGSTLQGDYYSAGLPSMSTTLTTPATRKRTQVPAPSSHRIPHSCELPHRNT